MTTSTTDHRKAAESRVQDLIAHIEALSPDAAGQQLIEECQALARAIAAFHMEGIRFRMYNVDRTLSRGLVTLPEPAKQTFADVRRHLEAAGFQTRSHQAPHQ